MPLVVYSDDNVTSSNIGRAILAAGDFEELEKISGYRHFRSDSFEVLGIDSGMLTCDYLDSIIKTNAIIFACSHRSSKGIASFTVHPEGNWSSEAKMGGKPNELSVAAPDYMLSIMESLKRNNDTALPVIYEATHHGPLLKTPSMFVEVGGSKEALESEEYAALVAKSVMDALSDSPPESGIKECVLGIGGMHYADKFTRLAFEKGYAFSHMMAKYYVSETGMLGQAVERSSIRAEKAVIEWKSIKAADRENIIKELDGIGIGYERV